MVYDEEEEVHYIFGGNPGGKEGKEGRLRYSKYLIFRANNIFKFVEHLFEYISTGTLFPLTPSIQQS